MKEILSLLPKPSRYIGIEEGSVKVDVKKIANAKSHIVFAFPDLYEIGMSYLGHKILYAQVNGRENSIAERVFAPCADAGKILKEQNVPLASMESDTNLKDFNAIGFALTHELASTNILYMLDLAQIPLKTEDRGDDFRYPIIFVGGGCTICAEMLAPYVDVMMLGEGELLLPYFLDLLEEAQEKKWTKTQFLEELRFVKGMYIPSFFEEDNTSLKPKFKDYTEVQRVLVSDIDNAVYPRSQASPFGAIHNRLTLEIARGCTRGCRFCQAGFTMRPSRERSVEAIKEIFKDAVKATGYEDVSFLSLSAGDFSSLKGLFLDVAKQCADEQISLSLPSLRVGSIDSDIMECIANIRRTGATLAPEAGSQRLRDVINKGITEEALMQHVRQLLYYGWQQVKLYFMIGLPTETDEDLEAIIQLAKKVRNTALYFDENGKRRGQQIQVTIALSPFVPKTHTPFQWEAQISLEEMARRIFYIRDLAKKEKNIKIRWHEPAMSHLEGILSRADRKMAKVLLSAYNKGAKFDSWVDQFNIDIWREAMQENGLSIDSYTGARNFEDSLAWEHLNTGLTKDFLLKERQNALEENITPDCRYDKCSLCGVCDHSKEMSILRNGTTPDKYNIYKDVKINTTLNQKARDQQSIEISDEKLREKLAQGQKKEFSKTNPPKIEQHLVHKAVRYKVWHNKKNDAAYLSQLEVQPLLERAFRRAGIAMTFSQGFHPLPLLSFGKALPVGVESMAEWFAVTLREYLTEKECIEKLAPYMLDGMEIIRLEEIALTGTIAQATSEIFQISFPKEYLDKAKERLNCIMSAQSLIFAKLNKQEQLKKKDIHKMLGEFEWRDNNLQINLLYTDYYLSPQSLTEALFNGKNLESELAIPALNILPVRMKIMKLAQFFE